MDDPKQRYWVGAPRGWRKARGAPAGLLVSVHGISRNAAAHARTLAALADELDLVLVAPHFSRSRFPDYQRMGRAGRLGPGGRADHMLLRIVQAVRSEFGLAAQPLLLMGHSGGAQFALRFALVHPAQVAAYALSAPGSHCWPDTGRRFPHGAAASRDFPDLRPDLHALLRRPGRGTRRRPAPGRTHRRPSGPPSARAGPPLGRGDGAMRRGARHGRAAHPAPSLHPSGVGALNTAPRCPTFT